MSEAPVLPPDSVIEALIVEGQERALPPLVFRELPLSQAPGKASVLIGMRRSGKTYRLFHEMQILIDQGALRRHMLYLNLEDDRLGRPSAEILSRALEIFYRRAPEARAQGAWIFFDEIQVAEGWERFVRRLLDTERAQVYITGSSARLLSTEIASAFRGRSLTTEVLPYSVREAAVADGRGGLCDEGIPGPERRSEMDAFIEEYLRIGGFPTVRRLNPFDRIQALQEYVDLVVLRDVAERHGSSNLLALRELVAALFAANAGGFSVSRLHGSLTSQGWRVTKATLLTYLDHLLDAFLFFALPLRTRSARQRSVNPRRMYAIDPGLAAAMYRGGATNTGAQLENAVYLRLRRAFGRLSEGALGWYKTQSGKEVDFAIDDPLLGGPPSLVQVCASLDDPTTRAREMAALVEAMAETGAARGVVVSLSHEETLDVPGGKVCILPARRCLFTRAPWWREGGAAG